MGVGSLSVVRRRGQHVTHTPATCAYPAVSSLIAQRPSSSSLSVPHAPPTRIQHPPFSWSSRLQALSEITGREEDGSYGNLKMGIMIVSVICGFIAQFYPLPFPANRALLSVCVVIYFALSSVLQYQMSIHDRDFVWACKAQVRAPSQAAAGSATEKRQRGPPPPPKARTSHTCMRHPIPPRRVAGLLYTCAAFCGAPGPRQTLYHLWLNAHGARSAGA